MSTLSSDFVLRVMKVLPQPQVTFVSTYFGWIFSFIVISLFKRFSPRGIQATARKARDRPLRIENTR
jgi:hypothetical protein